MTLAKTVNIGKIIHSVTLHLPADTVEWIDDVAAGLSRTRQAAVTRSEAVTFMVQRHWVKVMKRTAEKRSERSLGPKLGLERSLGPKRGLEGRRR